MTQDIPFRNRPRAPRGQPARTFHRLMSVETDECIEWPHARTLNGYGRVNVRGRTECAYALACEMRHGPRPPGMEAAHSCGNPPCMNYRHLRWATQSENMMDRVGHGTSNRGERNGGRRLSIDDVRVIRARAANGETREAIARDYGVHPGTVHAAVVRLSWFWLDAS